ncbi:MAG TPA: hypothetical protein DEA08_05050 [Planctomycetes bacterium]|mgnify:CR=1 FL=1|nr:hypothetical protein [Planctomycetota bacterium]
MTDWHSVPHGAPLSRRGVLRVGLLALGSVLVAGCGGGPPRKPLPPSERGRNANRREKFWIPGVADEWHESPVIIRGVKQLGGVLECEVDETDGKYVVLFNPQRTSRDAIRVKIIEIGRENGREFDPIFEDR